MYLTVCAVILGFDALSWNAYIYAVRYAVFAMLSLPFSGLEIGQVFTVITASTPWLYDLGVGMHLATPLLAASIASFSVWVVAIISFTYRRYNPSSMIIVYACVATVASLNILILIDARLLPPIALHPLYRTTEALGAVTLFKTNEIRSSVLERARFIGSCNTVTVAYLVCLFIQHTLENYSGAIVLHVGEYSRPLSTLDILLAAWYPLFLTYAVNGDHIMYYKSKLFEKITAYLLYLDSMWLQLVVLGPVLMSNANIWFPELKDSYAALTGMLIAIVLVIASITYAYDHLEERVMQRVGIPVRPQPRQSTYEVQSLNGSDEAMLDVEELDSGTM
eukprot:182488-Rhodomonas_salina.1